MARQKCDLLPTPICSQNRSHTYIIIVSRMNLFLLPKERNDSTKSKPTAKHYTKTFIMKFSPFLLSCTAFLALTQSVTASAGGVKGSSIAQGSRRVLKDKIKGPEGRECEFSKSMMHILINLMDILD